MNIRAARVEDLMQMQAANLQNLPENYSLKFWIYHAMSWPQTSFVAEDHKGRIVGYVLTKVDERDGQDVSGHVNSISVLRSYRRLGLAKKLMERCQEAMTTIYRAKWVSLHVRKSNKAAISLYKDSLGFAIDEVEKRYYGDGEDALLMRLDLSLGSDSETT